MYFIRTDGSPAIGMGHVMRCLAIALELRDLGRGVTFILSNYYAIHKIKEYQLDYIVIPETNDMQQEIPHYKSIFPPSEKNAVLVDSYRASDEYLEQLQKLADVYVIDGILQCKADITGIICFNPSANLAQYEERYSGKNTIRMIGSQYIPLRAEFKERRPHRSMERRQVLLTTGSTDQYHISEAFCAIWEKRELWKRTDLNVVVGGLFKDTNWLPEYPHIRFYRNVQRMSDLMETTDVAICQAGTTVFELLSQGVPTISFAINDIQRTFSQLQPIIQWGGCIQGDCRRSSEILEAITDTVVELLDSPETLEKVRADTIQCFDGGGAVRIARTICETTG